MLVPYSILRSIPNKILGVIAMFMSLLVLLIIPYLHLGLITSSLFRPIYKILLLVFALNYVLLTWIGQSVVETPYIELGQIFTVYYFGFLLILIPIISFTETLFITLLQKNKISAIAK